jgi:hypothetical protein
MRKAMDARDHAAIVALLAPDVVLYSPILRTGRFEGRRAVSELFAVLLEHYEEWQCLHECEGDGVHALIARARVRGSEIDMVDVIRHDSNGRVCEVRVLARSLSGVAILTAVLAPALARKRSRWRGVVMRVVTAPLPLMLRAGEQVGARLSMP